MKRITITAQDLFDFSRSPHIRTLAPQTTMLLAMKLLKENGFDLQERIASFQSIEDGGFVVGQSESPDLAENRKICLVKGCRYYGEEVSLLHGHDGNVC